MKRCRKCGQEKPLSEFHAKKSKRDGKNPWCKTCAGDAQKDWHKRTGRWAKRRGITPQQYDDMVQQQGGGCGICGGQGKPLLIDHDHQTGIVRGLLCHSCNIGLGLLGDSLKAVAAALHYLKRKGPGR